MKKFLLIALAIAVVIVMIAHSATPKVSFEITKPSVTYSDERDVMTVSFVLSDPKPSDYKGLVERLKKNDGDVGLVYSTSDGTDLSVPLSGLAGHISADPKSSTIVYKFAANSFEKGLKSVDWSQLSGKKIDAINLSVDDAKGSGHFEVPDFGITNASEEAAIRLANLALTGKTAAQRAAEKKRLEAAAAVRKRQSTSSGTNQVHGSSSGYAFGYGIMRHKVEDLQESPTTAFSESMSFVRSSDLLGRQAKIGAFQGIQAYYNQAVANQ